LVETYPVGGGAIPVELVVMVTASSLAKLHLHSNAARCGLDGEKVASDRCP